MTVISRHPGATLQVIVDTFRNMTAPETMLRIGRLAEGMPIRVQWAGLPTLVFQRDMMGIQAPLVEIHEQFKREGRDFWTGYAHVAVTSTLSVQSSLIFAQSNDYVWHEVVSAEGDTAKAALLRDPDWRLRARESWNTKTFEFSPFPEGRAEHLLLMNTDNGVGPTHLTLGEYQQQIGAVHPSDAMAEWLLANGLQSTVTMPPFESDRDMVLQLMRDPWTVGNISDAGAHGQMLCGAGENIKLFTDFVRAGELTLEEAVYIQTGKLADHFGFRDRGILAAGKRADITVFDLDEVQERDMKRVFDVPDGKGGFTWRWSRDPAPMRLTMVNGEVTFDGKQGTGACPGTMLAPAAA